MIAITVLFCVAETANAVGTWTPLANPAPDAIELMLLLPDGTVMAANGGGRAWYRLTPDANGNYANGTWSTVAPMHATRLYFSSDILPDGRVFVAGGEYGDGYAQAEVYDPLKDTWTLAPTSGQDFEDSISKLLPNGNVLISPVYPSISGRTIIYNPGSNSWSNGPVLFRGSQQSEASWVKLPDDSILTVDPYGTNSERYIPSLNQWINDANLPVSLYDSNGELGAGILLPDGRAFFIGGTGHTALYTPSGNTSAGVWAAGPDVPNGLGTSDAPAAMMVNGKILCAAGSFFDPPTSFFEYDPVANSFTAVSAPSSASQDVGSFATAMLDLPDGTVLFSEFDSQLYVYQPDGSPIPAGKPTITGFTTNANGTYHLSGLLFNGISEGAAYGDDAQMDSNYPLVRLTDGGGHVYYGRTFNWSRTSVMTGNAPVTTEFALPPGLPPGNYSLSVVANGISSDTIPFTVPYDLLVVGSAFNATRVSGSPFQPTNSTFLITNLAIGPQSWGIVNTSSWLNVSSSGGLLASGAGTKLTVSLNPSAANLPEGDYVTTLLFTNSNATFAQARQFILHVVLGELVENGGFETRDFTYWDFFGDATYFYVDSGSFFAPHSGYESGVLGTFGSNGGIFQTLATSAGQQYLLSFWLYCDGETPNDLSVYWDDALLFSQANFPALGWTDLHFVVTSSTEHTPLGFILDNDPSYFGLDDISVLPIYPPAFQSMTKTNGAFQFSWNTTPGLGYQVQYSTNLAQTNWLPLGPPVEAASSRTTASDSIGPDAQRFYRVVLLP